MLANQLLIITYLRNMKTRMIFLLCLSILAISPTFGQEISAKRKAPNEVTAVAFKGIEYSAPTFKKGFDSTMGIVFATSKATGEILWHKQVYQVDIDPNLEGDVQTVYIKSLKRKGNHLIIVNERDKSFKMNLKTQEVSAIN